MQTIAQKLETVEKSLRRWQTRLLVATNKVTKLDRQRRRLQSLPATTPFGKDKPKAAPALDANEMFSIPVEPKPKVPDEIPLPELDAFFEIPKELKVTVDVEKLRAERRKREAAEAKKMPLTDKAALAYIKGKRKR